ncbi:hypothetical protein JZ751_001294, partial [Albula glossodonta]
MASAKSHCQQRALISMASERITRYVLWQYGVEPSRCDVFTSVERSALAVSVTVSPALRAISYLLLAASRNVASGFPLLRASKQSLLRFIAVCEMSRQEESQICFEDKAVGCLIFKAFLMHRFAALLKLESLLSPTCVMVKPNQYSNHIFQYQQQRALYSKLNLLSQPDHGKAGNKHLSLVVVNKESEEEKEAWPFAAHRLTAERPGFDLTKLQGPGLHISMTLPASFSRKNSTRPDFEHQNSNLYAISDAEALSVLASRGRCSTRRGAVHGCRPLQERCAAGAGFYLAGERHHVARSLLVQKTVGEMDALEKLLSLHTLPKKPAKPRQNRCLLKPPLFTHSAGSLQRKREVAADGT